MIKEDNENDSSSSKDNPFDDAKNLISYIYTSDMNESHYHDEE
jgi:hypothetical protein